MKFVQKMRRSWCNFTFGLVMGLASIVLLGADVPREPIKAGAGMQQPGQVSWTQAVDNAADSHITQYVILVSILIAFGCIVVWVYGSNISRWISAMWESAFGAKAPKEARVGGN